MKMKRLLAALLAVLTLLTAVPSVLADEIGAADAPTANFLEGGG